MQKECQLKGKKKEIGAFSRIRDSLKLSANNNMLGEGMEQIGLWCFESMLAGNALR